MWAWYWTFRFHKMFGSSQVAALVAASQGLSFIKLACYLLTLWSWVPFERPQVLQPLGSFPAFNGTQRFITTFTRALHLYLPWPRLMPSTTPNPISKRSILILSIHHLGLSSGLYLLVFLPITYTCSSSPPFVPHDPPTSSSSTW
jgi:hypothetical protein